MRKHFNIMLIAALLGAIATTPNVASGDNPSRTTYLTFDRPIALPGVQMNAGTYVFEVASEQTSANIVRVTSRDRSKVYLMAFTQRIERPAGMSGNQSVMFGEAPRGSGVPIRAWFPTGEQSGHEFIYHH
jgi:hypothetical protein